MVEHRHGMPRKLVDIADQRADARIPLHEGLTSAYEWFAKHPDRL